MGMVYIGHGIELGLLIITMDFEPVRLCFSWDCSLYLEDYFQCGA